MRLAAARPAPRSRSLMGAWRFGSASVAGVTGGRVGAVTVSESQFSPTEAGIATRVTPVKADCP